MKTLDIRDIATDLRRAAKYYLEDALTDRLGGKLREWFDEALQQRGMQDITEIVEPAAVFVEENPGGSGTMVIRVGSAEYTIKRVVTPPYIADVDEIQADTDKFLAEVHAAVCNYAQTLAPETAVATVPALCARVEAYTAQWFLWGYAGTPN